MKYDVLIIGGGAAGLMAMKTLLKAGHTVCLLEADKVAGGRMQTITSKSFNGPVELGAEFIHGKLPLTMKILKEAGIAYEKVAGDMISVKKGKWNESEEHEEHWPEFMKQLIRNKENISIREFLQRHFAAPKYERLRLAVQRFAEGFDLADIDTASILGVQKEWQHEDEDQYRVCGGYVQMVNYLIRECKNKQGKIHVNSCVEKIEHIPGSVIATTTTNKKYTATTLLVTVSVGVLQAGNIVFSPPLTSHEAAIKKLGFGAVIKILLQFNNDFWSRYSDNIGFILSDETIPTWWTQAPQENNLLTGWIGGQKAMALSAATEKHILEEAMRSLCNIFQLTLAQLQPQLLQYKIICWHNMPFVKGGYSFTTTESAEARKILLQTVNDTIFLAGEALFEGDAQGTVEAALHTGVSTAKKILKILKG